jgi:hypothetical protein
MHNLIHNIRNVWAMQINPAYYEALDDTGKVHMPVYQRTNETIQKKLIVT